MLSSDLATKIIVAILMLASIIGGALGLLPH